MPESGEGETQSESIRDFEAHQKHNANCGCQGNCAKCRKKRLNET